MVPRYLVRRRFAGILAVACIAILAPTGARAAQNATVSGPTLLGRSLEDHYSLTLDQAAGSQGLSVTLQVDDPTACALSSDRNQAGSATLTLQFGAGETRVPLWVQGLSTGTAIGCQVSGAAGNPVTVTPLAVLLADGPPLVFVSLAPAYVTADVPDPFHVETQVGGRCQSLIPGLPPVSVHVCSDTASTGLVLSHDGTDTDAEPACETVTLAAGDCDTGTVTFAPDSTYTAQARYTNVSGSAPGFTGAQRSVAVTSSAAMLAHTDPDAVGVDLEDTFTLRLSPAAPAALSFTVSVPAGAPCVLAASEATTDPDATSLTIPFGAGQTQAHFAIRGLAESPDGCHLTATTASNAYAQTSDLGVMPIKARATRLAGVDRTSYPGAGNDDFVVQVGVANNSGTNLRWVQVVRPGVPVPPGFSQPGISVTACSTNTGVEQIAGVSGQCAAALIAAGQSSTADGPGDADAALELHAVGAGTAVVYIADDNATDAGRVTVRVNTFVVTIHPAKSAVRIGVWEMTAVAIDASDNVTSPTDVQVTTVNPEHCLVTPTEGATDVPAASTTITIAAGRNRQTVIVHGIADGPCELQAAAVSPPTATSDDILDIVDGASQLNSLPTTVSISGSTGFGVQVGVPDATSATVQYTEDLRFNTTMTVCNSNPVVAKLRVGNNGATADCVSIDITRSHSATPSGLQFVPLTVGCTTVSVQPNTRIQNVIDAGSETVCVTPVNLTIDQGNDVVGAGLESRFRIQTSPANAFPAGGLPVRIASTSSACVVSDAATTAGTDHLDRTLTSPFYFWAQTVSLASPGNCTLTVTPLAQQASYVGQSRGISIQQAGIALSGAPASITVGQTLGFTVILGVPHGSTVNQDEDVSPVVGAATVTVSLSAVPAGQQPVAQLQLVAPSQTGQSVSFTIAGGTHDSTSAGISIKALAQGGTTITATSSGLLPTPNSQQPVTIYPTTPPGGGCG